MKSGDIATDSTEIKGITRKYYEQPYANTLDDVDKMKKFQKTKNLPRLNHEEIEKSEQTYNS